MICHHCPFSMKVLEFVRGLSNPPRAMFCANIRLNGLTKYVAVLMTGGDLLPPSDGDCKHKIPILENNLAKPSTFQTTVILFKCYAKYICQLLLWLASCH